MFGLVKNPLLVGALQVLGPLFFLGLQGSSARTALEILQNRSVGGYAFLPFVSLLTNCMIWSFYGILKNDYTVLVPNALGICTGLFCVYAYKKHSPLSADLPISLFACGIVLFALSLYLSNAAETLGLLGCCLAVLLMGSPLAAMSTVIRDKSTASMPFFTSFTTWCNALSWSMYGLLVANDPLVSVSLYCFCHLIRIFNEYIFYIPDIWPQSGWIDSSKYPNGVVRVVWIAQRPYVYIVDCRR